MSGNIIVERDEYVATITIDNPSKRNAMGRAMWEAMGDAMLKTTSAGICPRSICTGISEK